MTQDTQTYQEIATQTDAWKDAQHRLMLKQDEIKRLWQSGSYDHVIFTGCGSTYYLSQIAASLMQAHTGTFSRAFPASELLLHPESAYVRGKRALMVAISRSGATTETIQAANRFRDEQNSEVIVISCYADKPLNAPATVTIAAEKGQEVGIAQTRSFSAMLIMAEGFARLLGGETLDADLFTDASSAYIDEAQRIAAPLTDPEKYHRYFYLGSGARYGLAAEAMLKMKEMSLTYAEAFHPMEFRHGPKSMVDENTVVVGLLGEDGYTEEQAVLAEMKALGATTLCIAPQPDADISLAGYRPALVRTLPILQWMAYLRAVNKGLDPDKPRNLEQVVQLT